MNTILSKGYEIPRGDICIEKQNLLMALGVPKTECDDYLSNLIDTLTKSSLEISTPRAGFVLADAPTFGPDSTVTLVGQSLNLSPILYRAVRDCSHIAVFVGTVGFGLEQLSKQNQRSNNGLESIIIDTIGSEIAENISVIIHKLVEREVERIGLKVTNRYSPGYCGWPVTDQQALFKILNGNTQGVSITSSSLMVPIKSVSGIVGVGENAKNTDYQCAKCKNSECLYKSREKEKKENTDDTDVTDDQG